MLGRVFGVGICSIVLFLNLLGQEGVAVVDHKIGSFANAVSLSLGAAGQLFVIDAGRNELTEFSSSRGEIEKKIGGRGWGDLEFDAPTDVCTNFALDIYVADYNNRRLQRFDRKMNPVQSVTADNITPSLSGAFYPRASALSTQGELFVVESDGRRVLKFNSARQLEKEFGAFNAGAGALLDPRDIAVTPEEKVLVLDQHRVVEFDTYGNYVSSFTLDSLSVPSGISVTTGGFLVVDPQHVTQFSSDGTKLMQIAAESLMGVDAKEEFRDAFGVGSTLYILTQHALLVTNIVQP